MLYLVLISLFALLRVLTVCELINSLLLGQRRLNPTVLSLNHILGVWLVGVFVVE